MKVILVILICLGLIGCMTAPCQYSQVKFDDGINKYEAVAIAKHELVSSRKDGEYNIKKGSLIINSKTICASDYWLGLFPKTEQTLIAQYYYFLINKNTGKVLRAEPVAFKSNYWAVMLRDVDKCE